MADYRREFEQLNSRFAQFERIKEKGRKEFS